MSAIAGICFDNDTQVAHLSFTKAYDKDNPRIELTIEPVDTVTERVA